MNVYSRTLAAAALLAIALSGCGGGKSATSTTTTTTGAQTSATAPAMTEAQRETGALPQSAMAVLPAGLDCGATKPVWVNTHTKAYHEAGDPYYGRTKNGRYMCASAAVAAGYHSAGSRHKGVDTMATDGSSNEMGSPTGKQHKHHKKSGNDTMNGTPDATPTP